MALKQTVITRVEPDSPGWYWYRDGVLGWQPVEVYVQEGKVGQGLLYCCFYTDLPDSTAGTRRIHVGPISILEGEWGDEIPLPKAAHKSQTVSSILPKEGSRTTGIRRPVQKLTTTSVINQGIFHQFLYWIVERHNMYLRRHWPWPVGATELSEDSGPVWPELDPTSKKFKNTKGLMLTLAKGEYTTQNQKPWTDNLVLKSTFFTNPFRENDKTTQWFRENVRNPLRNDPSVIMATIIFRWFNYIPTGEALLSGGSPSVPVAKGKSPKPRQKPFLGLFTNWDSAKALELLKPMQKVFTGAHVVASGTQLADTGPRDGGGSPKVRSILDLIDRMWEKRRDLIDVLTPSRSPNMIPRSLQAAHEYLKSFPAIGDFQAYEIVSDLRHTHVLEDAPDILTWANAGPGAMRGLNRIFNRPISYASVQHRWVDEMRVLLSLCYDLILANRNKNPPPTHHPEFYATATSELKTEELVGSKRLPPGHPAFEMREIEHSLCEFDKYMRMTDPEDSTSSNPKNAKRKYNGTS